MERRVEGVVPLGAARLASLDSPQAWCCCCDHHHRWDLPLLLQLLLLRPLLLLQQLLTRGSVPWQDAPWRVQYGHGELLQLWQCYLLLLLLLRQCVAVAHHLLLLLLRPHHPAQRLH